MTISSSTALSKSGLILKKDCRIKSKKNLDWYEIKRFLIKPRDIEKKRCLIRPSGYKYEGLLN